MSTSPVEPPGTPRPSPPLPEAIAEQEQRQLWAAARSRPWLRRTWLRVLLLLAASLVLSLLIHYPLRVTAECQLVASERVTVRSELQGVISRVLADEGAVVHAGQVLVRLDERALVAERQSSVAALAKVEAELAALRKGHRQEELRRQQAILVARQKEQQFAAKEHQRSLELARAGVSSQQVAEAAERDLETKRQGVEEARAVLELLQAGTRPEELAAKEAELARARAELGYIEQKYTMLDVRSPIDGVVVTPRFRERRGEALEEGDLVCEVVSAAKMRAELLVPERELDAIELGQPVTVKVESYPSRSFEGKVEFIAPQVTGSDKRVRIVATLDNSQGLLRVNMSGYGQIDAESRSLFHLATRRILRWIRVRYLL